MRRLQRHMACGVQGDYRDKWNLYERIEGATQQAISVASFVMVFGMCIEV